MENNFLDVALKAVKNAEEIIMNYYKDEIRYTLKPDQTPVTLADKGAEEIIVKTIKKAFPDHGFLGEEGEREEKEYTWIIDPIDGTKNYLRKIPLFATQLALMHDGEIILGISNAPGMHELFYAEKGKGAFLNGKPVKVSETDDLGKSFLTFGSIRLFLQKDKLNKLLSLAGNVRGCKGFGDFYNYHLLASGRVDIAVESDCKIWDIAALTVIIREAGGMVSDINGDPITIKSTSVIASNKFLYPKVLSYF